MNPTSESRLKLICCEVLYREACHLAAEAPHRVDVEFLQKGLHDLETRDMVGKIQSAVDAAEAEDLYDAVLLGYARCNDGLVGVRARKLPLVIPRAHDCITLFFGSREAYRTYFDEHPGTYFETTGWMERCGFMDGELQRPVYGMEGVMAKLGLTESYDKLVEKYGPDNAKYVLDTLGGWDKAYSRLCYLEMGICDETPFIDRARGIAEEKGWAFERRPGDLSLLRKLIFGPWDEDMLVVPPGKRIAARNDEDVLGID